MGKARPKYEKPIVVDLQDSDLREASALCKTGASDAGTCFDGGTAGTSCHPGTTARLGCLGGGTAAGQVCFFGSTVGT